jgi:hypothetical protein
MKPVQVYFAEPEIDRLEAWARRRGVTKSDAIRAAVKALVRDRDDDPLLHLSGIADLGTADLSERVDEYLAGTHVGEGRAPYRRRRRGRAAVRR